MSVWHMSTRQLRYKNCFGSLLWVPRSFCYDALSPYRMAAYDSLWLRFINNRVRVRLTSQITLHRICADSHRRTWTFIWNFISDDWSFCIVGIWRISCSAESFLLKVTATTATPHVILVWVHLYVFNPHNAVGDLHVSRCSFSRPWPERILAHVAIQVSAWQCDPMMDTSASRESRGTFVFAAIAFAATAHGENCPN